MRLLNCCCPHSLFIPQQLRPKKRSFTILSISLSILTLWLSAASSSALLQRRCSSVGTTTAASSSSSPTAFLAAPFRRRTRRLVVTTNPTTNKRIRGAPASCNMCDPTTSTTTTTTSNSNSNNNMKTATPSSTSSSSSNLIDGKQIAADIRAEIKAQIEQLCSNNKSMGQPGLAVILVGSRRDSQTYVSMKKKACAAAGVVSRGYDFDETVTESELLETVARLNADPAVHGILVQLPLPAHLDPDRVLRRVDPRKDVDGLHPANVAALQLYNNNGNGDYGAAPFSIPCTPLGCLELLDRSGVQLRGAQCVVLGRSRLVGLPMARLLLGRDATVTICHSQTVNPAKVVSQADVVIAAVGRPHLVKADWIKEGAVVIDVGINSVDAEESTDPTKKPYRLVGDVDFAAVRDKCRKITPVPGGVGPMTIAMLLRNTLRSWERFYHAKEEEEEEAAKT